MNSEAILDLFRIVVLVFVLIGCIRLMLMKKNMAFVIFFTLGIACILFSDFYWLVYDVLRPNSRMPFAANEICEWSLFLLLSSALSANYPREYWSWKKEKFAVVLFVIGNVALWIGWSGEWMQDILTGVALSCFLCSLVCRVKYEGVLNGIWGILLAAAGFILILGQAGTFFAPERISKILDRSCYVLMFSVLAILIFFTILSLIKGTSAQSTCLSFVSFAGCVVTMYMSSEGFYLAAMILSAVCFVLMYAALKKEVMEE